MGGANGNLANGSHIPSNRGILRYLPMQSTSKQMVSDGDAVTELRETTRIKVRLAEIDAPEKSQPYGDQTAQSLKDWCLGKPVALFEHGKDRYGRVIGQLVYDVIDANAEQVRRGFAWAYKQYLTDAKIKVMADEAKAAQVGLWQDETPIPPWKYRKKSIES